MKPNKSSTCLCGEWCHLADTCEEKPGFTLKYLYIGDRDDGEVLTMKAWEHKFKPQSPWKEKEKSCVWRCVLAISALGCRETRGRLSGAHSQSSLLGKLQVSERQSHKIKWMAPEEQHNRLTSDLYTCVHMNIPKCAYTYTGKEYIHESSEWHM